MPGPHPADSRLTDRLAEVACLAHSVPGVTLRLHCASGAELLVSYSCLGADIDPCRLRATLLHERAHGARHLASAVRQIDVVAGLTALGASLYQRRGDVDERWFVTSLDPTDVAAALADGPEPFHTVIKPDLQLGLHAVCVRPLTGLTQPVPAELDEAAVWALGAVLAGELATELTMAADRTITRGDAHQRIRCLDQP